jgi:hypothetical protein
VRCACGSKRPIISDYVTLRAAAVTVRRPHGRGDRRPEGVHVDYAPRREFRGTASTTSRTTSRFTSRSRRRQVATARAVAAPAACASGLGIEYCVLRRWWVSARIRPTIIASLPFCCWLAPAAGRSVGAHRAPHGEGRAHQLRPAPIQADAGDARALVQIAGQHQGGHAHALGLRSGIGQAAAPRGAPPPVGTSGD